MRYHYDLDQAIEAGKIVFSSEERRRAIEATFEAWLWAYVKAQEIADDYVAAEERRIDEQHGMY